MWAPSLSHPCGGGASSVNIFLGRVEFLTVVKQLGVKNFMSHQ